MRQRLSSLALGVGVLPLALLYGLALLGVLILGLPRFVHALD